MKEIFAPHLNRNVKFGRKRPIAITPHMKLRNYLRASLPKAPVSADYTKAASEVLSKVFLNDQLGDCVIAGLYHVVGVETANAGSPFIATDAQILSYYEKIGGYIPGRPDTDGGCNEQDALNYCSQHGFANGTKPAGWLTVDATNWEEVQQALYLFENLIFGIELPDAWVNPFPSQAGFLWNVNGESNPENGHCIIGAGYSPEGVTIDSWGLLGILTPHAIAKYAVRSNGGELYVLLTPDQIAKGKQKAPNGVAWGDLVNDFNLIGGHVPVIS